MKQTITLCFLTKNKPTDGSSFHRTNLECIQFVLQKSHGDPQSVTQAQQTWPSGHKLNCLTFGHKKLGSSWRFITCSQQIEAWFSTNKPAVLVVGSWTRLTGSWGMSIGPVMTSWMLCLNQTTASRWPKGTVSHRITPDGVLFHVNAKTPNGFCSPC